MEKVWDNSATEIDKMTVAQWLVMLTNENWHSERAVVEAIIDGREEHIRTAMLIWMMHQNYGHMPHALSELRNELYKEMCEE